MGITDKIKAAVSKAIDTAADETDAPPAIEFIEQSDGRVLVTGAGAEFAQEHRELAGVRVLFTKDARAMLFDGGEFDAMSRLLSVLHVASAEFASGGAAKVLAIKYEVGARTELYGNATRTTAARVIEHTAIACARRHCETRQVRELTIAKFGEPLQPEWSAEVPLSDAEVAAKRLAAEREAAARAKAEEFARIERNRGQAILAALGGAALEADNAESIVRAVHALAAKVVEMQRRAGELGADYSPR
jgi:hypothetical protein